MHIDEQHRLSGLDLLRASCAVAVWAFHALYRFPVDGRVPWQPPTAVQNVASCGYLGVECFFMISGFVISLSAAGRSRRTFVSSRVARLMPAFWLCLGLAVIARLAVERPVTLPAILSNITLVLPIFRGDNLDDVYWSLQVEIVFYALVALFAVGPHFRSRLETFAWAWLALTCTDILVDLPAKRLHGSVWAPFFCIGMALYLYRAGGRGRHALLLASAIALGMVISWRLALAQSGAAQTAPLIAAAAIPLLAALTALSLRFDLPSRWHFFSSTAGRLSYPVYLLHAEVGTAILLLLYGNGAVGVAAGIAVVLLLSYAVIRVERHAAPIVRRYLDG